MRRISTLIITFTVLFTSLSSMAQENIPTDKAVRIGKLDNGLTYYIRHNEEPKGQANFYIAQKVGSMQEEENQRGLAHFLEHMCFNGTEHFPGNGITKYCESIGVKFGTDLNAYTSFDKTVYNINNVPVVKVPDAVDSCLMILHDWADGLLLTDDEIDHERGVIHEEWRSRSTAQTRMYESILEEVFAGSKYAERMPIGLMSVVDNFPYEVLRNYYAKWYRTDLQGIIVVGDIDVDIVEAKIKTIFGSIKAQANPAERIYVKVPDNKEPIIALAQDKENPRSVTALAFKHDVYPDEAKKSMEYFIHGYVLEVAEMMINNRVDELLNSAQPPFINASIYDDDLLSAKTKGAFMGSVITDENHITDGISAIYREMKRAAKYGFTGSEYERAKTELISQVETGYKQREKIDNDNFGNDYISNFLDGEPIISTENVLQLTIALAKSVPIEAINAKIASMVSDDNIVIFGMYPEKDGFTMPTDEQMLAAINTVNNEDIQPYEDKVIDKPLISEDPIPGKVIKTKESMFGYKKYLLSNGATVYLKTTDFNPDEVIMKAISKGGKSLYPDSEVLNLKAIDQLITLGGVGEFSKTDLTKVLSGKQLDVSPKIGDAYESISSGSTPKDFETMLQLNYLYFTALRTDSAAFESWKLRTEAHLRNNASNPMTHFKDSTYKAMYKNDIRWATLKSEEVGNVNYQRVMEIARERFSDASDFNFIITGNISDSVALPLIEKYIGSLPALNKKENYNPDILKYNEGQNSKVFDYKMKTPSVLVQFIDHSTAKYSIKKSIAFTLALHALNIELLEEIREKEGGTYGISASGSMDYEPYQRLRMRIIYQTSPDKYEYLNKRIEEIVSEFEKNGPRQVDIDKGKKFLIKKYHDGLRENDFYSSAMEDYICCGINTIDGQEELINSITTEDARRTIEELLKQNNHIEVMEIGVN